MTVYARTRTTGKLSFWTARKVWYSGVLERCSGPQRRTVLMPVTRAIGGTTSGSMHITSTTGRSRGAPSRTATRAGTARSRARAMVAAASPRESVRLSAKPSAERSAVYASKETPWPGVCTVKTNEATSGTRK